MKTAREVLSNSYPPPFLPLFSLIVNSRMHPSFPGKFLIYLLHFSKMHPRINNPDIQRYSRHLACESRWTMTPYPDCDVSRSRGKRGEAVVVVVV